MRIPIVLCAIILFGASTQHGLAQAICNPVSDVQSASNDAQKNRYAQQRAAWEAAQTALDGSVCLTASTTCSAIVTELGTLKDDLATLARHIGASGEITATQSGFCIAAGAYSVGPQRSAATTATGRYRTVCVRPVDGLFFPINFGVTAAQLPEDERSCVSQCAEGHMYYYSIPDGRIEDAVDLDGRRYRDSASAFAYLTAFYPNARCGKGAAATPVAAAVATANALTVDGLGRLVPPTSDINAAPEVRQVGPAYLYFD